MIWELFQFLLEVHTWNMKHCFPCPGIAIDVEQQFCLTTDNLLLEQQKEVQNIQREARNCYFVHNE